MIETIAVRLSQRAGHGVQDISDFWRSQADEILTDLEPAIWELTREAAAELSRLSALVAWQDIETAPRDGTPIIGAFWTIRWADSHRRGDIVRCWYQPEFGAFISSAREMTLAPGLTFEDGTSRQIHSPVIEPVTHWMHLHPFTAAKEG